MHPRMPCVFLYALLVSSSVYLPVLAQDNEDKPAVLLYIRTTTTCLIRVVSCGVVGGAALPIILYAAGFTGAGISGGSLAAYLMSLAMKTGYGMWIVSFGQSAGAAGFAWFTKISAGAVAVKSWCAGDCLEPKPECHNATTCLKDSYTDDKDSNDQRKGYMWCCKLACDPEVLMCGFNK